MALIHMASFTVAALAVGSSVVGSSVVGSSLLDRSQQTPTSATPQEVRLLQCAPTQDTRATAVGSSMAAYCESAYAANLRQVNWAAVFHTAWR